MSTVREGDRRHSPWGPLRESARTITAQQRAQSRAAWRVAAAAYARNAERADLPVRDAAAAPTASGMSIHPPG